MGDPTIEAARELFDEAFGQIRDAIEGLSAEALAWRPPAEDTNPITVLATHGLHSTRWWLTIARGAPLPDRDRPSEFVAETCSAEELLSFADRMVSDCRARLEPAEPWGAGAPRTLPADEPVPSAWARRHAPAPRREAQLTRQLWERQA